MDNYASLALYGDLLPNFGATYAATLGTMKSQVDSLVAMQGQLANIQQFCMAKQHLRPHSAAMHVHQSQKMQRWWSKQRSWFLAAPNHEFWRYRWWPTKPMGSLFYEYFPEGNIIEPILDAVGSNLMVYSPC